MGRTRRTRAADAIAVKPAQKLEVSVGRVVELI
mgnify:CR=1 FL=1